MRISDWSSDVCSSDLAKPEQALGQGLDHGLVAGLVGHARPRLRQRGGLRGADQVVQRALLLAEAAVDREGAGDVGRVAADLGAGVDQHQVAIRSEEHTSELQSLMRISYAVFCLKKKKKQKKPHIKQHR